MRYICVDRGSQRCPCHLMEVGQCYTCSMLRTGVCDCDQATGWQGVCPYTEFVQQGGKARPPVPETEGEIFRRVTYSEELVVVKVKVTRGFAEQCRHLGTFVMAEALGYKTPLSVLRVGKEEGSWLLHFAVKPAGPKTFQLLRRDCQGWKLTGPFHNGLINCSVFNSGKESLVIGKGTAIASYLCACGEKAGGTEFYLDPEKLTADFLEEYMENIDYIPIHLKDSQVQRELEEKIKETARKQEKNIFLLVSPYYAKKLTEGLSGTERMIWPNPANMCCGEGICGACAHTDAQGMTVRLCKCSRAAL